MRITVIDHRAPADLPPDTAAVDVEHAARSGVEQGLMDADVDVDVIHTAEPGTVCRLLADASSDGIVLGAGPLAEDPAVAAAVGTAPAPVVAVSPDPRPQPEPTAVAAAATAAVEGRGTDVFRWAVRHLLARRSWPPTTLPYGPGDEHVGDLRVPPGDGPHPVVVLLHGGFWRDQWRRDLMDAEAIDLARRGYATWNLEYRRVGWSGGGWPTTLEDVAAGIQALGGLAGEHHLGTDAVALCGHSAGGQLALLAATGARRADAAVQPLVAVSLAGVLDLRAALDDRLGAGAVAELLAGAPDGALAEASPIAQVPLGVRQVLVHGTQDQRVPPGQSRAHHAAAVAAGDPVTLVELPGVDHFAFLDTGTSAWAAVREQLEAVVPLRRR